MTQHPVIVAIAPTGARKTKADHPRLPMTVQEIAQEAARCHRHGAAVLHLHVRDKEGGHLLDADAYTQATAAVRRQTGDGLVVQITTEAVGLYSAAEQMAVVQAVRPEAVSVALRELAPDGEEATFFHFMEWAWSERIAVQIILYDRADGERLSAFAAAGNLPDSGWTVLYVLGRYSQGQRSAPGDLLAFLNDGRSPFPEWMLCAFGPDEARCLTFGSLLGGGVRTGFENNFHLSNGTISPDNGLLVKHLITGLAGLGLSLADADQVRRRWRPAGG